MDGWFYIDDILNDECFFSTNLTNREKEKLLKKINNETIYCPECNRKFKIKLCYGKLYKIYRIKIRNNLQLWWIKNYLNYLKGLNCE